MSHEVDEKDVEASSDIEDAGIDDLDEAGPEDEVIAGEFESTDNVGDVSVEINVEELIADIEKENDEDVARKKEIRRRLEELAEEKSMEDTFAVDLGDQKS